jgi:hypothetical protein
LTCPKFRDMFTERCALPIWGQLLMNRTLPAFCRKTIVCLAGLVFRAAPAGYAQDTPAITLSEISSDPFPVGPGQPRD